MEDLVEIHATSLPVKVEQNISQTWTGFARLKFVDVGAQSNSRCVRSCALIRTKTR